MGPPGQGSDTDVAETAPGMLPGDHTVEIELWYRQSADARARAQSEVSALVELGRWQGLSVAQVGEVGYHGIKCSVPLNVLQWLASGDYEAIAAVKSSHVMYLRVTAQAYALSDQGSQATRLPRHSLAGTQFFASWTVSQSRTTRC